MLEAAKRNHDAIRKECQGIQCRWWDIYSNDVISRSVTFKNNMFHSARESAVQGYGIRLNIHKQTGFSYCNDFNDIQSVIDHAKDTAQYGDNEDYELPGKNGLPEVTLYDEQWLKSWTVEDQLHQLQAIIDTIRKEYSDCIVDSSAGCVDGYVYLTNSSGFEAGYRYVHHGVSVSVLRIVSDGSRIQVYESSSWGSAFDYHEIVNRLIMKLRFSETNAAIPSGNYYAILTPKAFSQIMGVVLQGLSGKSIQRGISRYKGKFGQKIFGKQLSVHDNPLENYAPGSYPFDGEGVMAFNKMIIEHGYVQRHIAHLQSSHILQCDPTGNASRSYATLPQESFSNIVVPGGDVSFKDMITQMGTGIIIDQFIGFGQSNTLMGQFSANLDLAWFVNKGEVQGRLKNCMVADDVMSMLDDTIVLSKEREWIGDSYLPYVMCRINYTTI